MTISSANISVSSCSELLLEIQTITNFILGLRTYLLFKIATFSRTHSRGLPALSEEVSLSTFRFILAGFNQEKKTIVYDLYFYRLLLADCKKEPFYAGKCRKEEYGDQIIISVESEYG